MIYVNARFLTQPVTGVQRYAFGICSLLKQIDPAIQFLCPQNILQNEWAIQLEVKKIGIFKGHLWEQTELPLFLSTQKEAVLFSPCNTGPLFLRRHFFTLHDLSFKLYPRFNRLLFRYWYQFLISRLAKKAKHIFTVSETVRKEIIQHYAIAANKVSVTYNGVEAGMKPSYDTRLQKQKIVLAVGSLNQRKNPDLLISAFLSSGLSSRYSLVLIGRTDRIYKYRKFNPAPGVQIIEDAGDAVLQDYYSRAEIFVNMSIYEGFGIPVLEALYYKCKVICADIPVFRELYDECVHFCDAGNEEALSTLLTQMPDLSILQADKLAALKEKYDYMRSASLVCKMLKQT